MTNKYKNKKAGFTLIETLVAVLLLATALAGPLTIASRGLNTALVAKNQLTAFYLAQDGMEYVRFIRDTNQLNRPGVSDWLAGLDGTSNGFTVADASNGDCVSTTGTSYCVMDSTGLTTIPGTYNIASCPTSATPCSGFPLYYDATNHRFTYTSGNTKTIYTRIISILTPVCSTGATPVCNSDEAQVTVKVQWADVGTTSRSVSVHENIFNWQP